MEELIQAMATRHSVRKYQEQGLSPDQLKQIDTYLQGIKPLRTDANIKAYLLTHEHVTSFVNAPHFYAFYANKNVNGYLEELGAVVGELDLYLHTQGWGCCIMGMVKSKKDAPIPAEDTPILFFAFGIAKEELVRSEKDIKRKAVGKISNQPENTLINLAHYAPSAMNSQPWYMQATDNQIDLYLLNKSLMAGMLKSMNRIDLGIITKYLLLIIEYKLGKTAKVLTIENPLPKLGEYLWSLSY
jgi:nitroreductase